MDGLRRMGAGLKPDNLLQEPVRERLGIERRHEGQAARRLVPPPPMSYGVSFGDTIVRERMWLMSNRRACVVYFPLKPCCEGVRHDRFSDCRPV